MNTKKDFNDLMHRLYGEAGPTYVELQLALIIWDAAIKSCSEFHNNILMALSKEVLM